MLKQTEKLCDKGGRASARGHLDIEEYELLYQGGRRRVRNECGNDCDRASNTAGAFLLLGATETSTIQSRGQQCRGLSACRHVRAAAPKTAVGSACDIRSIYEVYILRILYTRMRIVSYHT